LDYQISNFLTYFTLFRFLWNSQGRLKYFVIEGGGGGQRLSPLVGRQGKRKIDFYSFLIGAAVTQLVEFSPLVLGVVGSIPAHAMLALWWINTVCMGYLGVFPFPPTFFIPPTHPSGLSQSCLQTKFKFKFGIRRK